jgi:hypothetical protein
MKHYWHSTDGILTIADVQQWCKWMFAGNCTAIEIDWQDIGTLHDIGAIAQLFSFLCEAKSQGIAVNHINQEQNDQVVEIIDSYCKDTADLDIYAVSNILSVNTPLEERIESEKINFIDFIQPNILGLNKDLEGIKNLFGELFMNICHHSKKQSSGYVCVAKVDTNTRVVYLAASDLGKGIPSTLKNDYPEIANDSGLILKAIEKGVSCKSTVINQGKGLDNVNSLVHSTNGNWQIYSGNGFYDSRADTKQPKTHTNHIGTLIVIQIPLDNLPDSSSDIYGVHDIVDF